jgi:GT2 family glycosyltransferase
MVSIVIHAAAGADRLRACVSSVLDRTVYDPYEIVIAGAASGDFELSACLGELADLPHCRVIECEPSLNCSAAHNVAARHARGDFLVLLDSRAEVVSEEWLHELVMWGSRDGIGTVGCRLRYPEGASPFAGVLLGSPWVGSYEMPFDASSSLGYFGRMATVHEVGANSARCLLVRRRDYLEVGGLDADTFPGAMNDVDLCLKLRQLGRRNVWTPHVEVCQHDSDLEDTRRGPGGRDRIGGACAALRRRWGELLLADPAYNPNLTTEREAFSLAWPPRVGRFEGSAPKGCGVERASR